MNVNISRDPRAVPHGLRRLALILALAALLGSTAVGLNALPVAAFNCPAGGSTTVQGNAYDTPASNYDLHGWLGNCAQGWYQQYVQWYAGEDSRSTWGGAWHNVSYMSIHLRVWVCGALQYDQTAAYYNSAYINLVAPQYYYRPGPGGCVPQADASGYETAGNWGWSWYLTPPFA